MAARADELEIEEGEWEPRRRLKEACDHAKAEAAQAERQVEARRAALQAWEGSARQRRRPTRRPRNGHRRPRQSRKRVVEEAEAACGDNPPTTWAWRGCGRVGRAVCFATAASDAGAASDFFAVYASDQRA